MRAPSPTQAGSSDASFGAVPVKSGCSGCSAAAPCTKCSGTDEALRRKPHDEGSTGAAVRGPEVAVAPELASDVGSLRGHGQPLSPGVRGEFEGRFGRSFEEVRVHTDARAARTADALNARAYTMGSDIAFGAGQYAPESHAGQKLLAHELAHVASRATGTVQRFSYGTGTHATGGGNTLSEVTAAERGGANGFDAAMRIVNRVITGRGHRPDTCRQWFADNCTDVPTPTAQDLHNRAVVWMWRFADGAPRAGNNGLTDGGDKENHAINERVFNNRSRWEIAAVMVHEYWHDCESGQPDIGDGAKIACGLPNT
jgi:hypothetical protein